MTITGFSEQDFKVFEIDGLEPRMESLIQLIRPKLEKLGQDLAPELASLTGEEMYVHVAKHARRTVNPPNDTWVAWANNKRGYKQHPHFQVGLWGTHLFIWFAMIYESPIKGSFAKLALEEKESILKQIPAHYVWSDDHMKPEVIRDMNEDKLEELLQRLHKVKKSEFLVGVQIPRGDELLTNGQALTETILDTFATLTPLYKLALRA